MIHRNKIINAVYSAIVADSLGVPYEFTSRDEMKANPATTMRGFGTYNKPAGSWSDDSSMMLCIMEWLTEMKLKYTINVLESINYSDYCKLKDKWIKWYLKGYMTPDGVCFDIGNQTRECLMEDNLYNDSSMNPTAQGNGALMRILPFGFLCDDFCKVHHVMSMTNAITHGSFVSQDCCKNMLELYGLAKVMNTNDFIEACSNAMNLNVDLRGSGWVLQSLTASLWCIVEASKYSTTHEDFYKKTVLNAVNLGEDTDTTAIIAGGLVGMHLNECVPPEWKKLVRNKELIDNVISKFCDAWEID